MPRTNNSRTFIIEKMETNVTLHTKDEEDEYKERVSYEFSLRAPFHIYYTKSEVIPPPYLPRQTHFIFLRQFSFAKLHRYIKVIKLLIVQEKRKTLYLA